MTDPREAVIDRILNGQPGPVDTDEREPDPVSYTHLTLPTTPYV